MKSDRLDSYQVIHSRAIRCIFCKQITLFTVSKQFLSLPTKLVKYINIT